MQFWGTQISLNLDIASRSVGSALVQPFCHTTVCCHRCCPSLTDGSVHPSVTWSLSSCVVLRFPLSSPVVSTKPWFSSWDRGINREIRCQRCVHQKDFLWRWPTCGGALAEEGVRLAPLVTLTDSCYCSECKINATRHNWTIVNARAKQSVLCEHPVVPQTATRG